MITVHHLENSRSQRILWLLEELEIPYEMKRYMRDKKTMLAPPDLKRVHPLGKSPVLTDDGTTAAETGAIIEYILEKYGNGRLMPPPHTPEHLRYTYWLHYAEGSAMTPLLLKLIFSRLSGPQAPFLARPILRRISKRVQSAFIDPQIALHVGYWEQELSKSAWFAGADFTAADIQMSFPIEAASARGGAKNLHPNLASFLDRIHARPAYKRALERGGPYQLAS